MSRRIVVCFLAALAFLACEPTTPDEAPNVTTLQLTGEDMGVYEAVMANLDQILPPAPPPPPGAAGAVQHRKPHLFVWPETERGTAAKGDATELKAGNWFDGHGRLTPTPAEMGSAFIDMQKRNHRRASLTGFTSRRVDIEFSRSPGFFAPSVAFSIPGYSRTHEIAIVEMSLFAASMGSGQLFVFRRSGERWALIAKRNTWIS